MGIIWIVTFLIVKIDFNWMLIDNTTLLWQHFTVYIENDKIWDESQYLKFEGHEHNLDCDTFESQN